ncbi:hypothetical protein D3C72_2470230 [compost metagenome]
MFRAPGGFAVVFQQRPVGLVVTGVDDPPALVGAVQGNFIVLAIQVDELSALVGSQPLRVGFKFCW